VGALLFVCNGIAVSFVLMFLLIFFRGIYCDRSESSIKTNVDLNRGCLFFLPLKQQKVLRDEMAMCFRNRENMIADCDRLALYAIHVVGIDD